MLRVEARAEPRLQREEAALLDTFGAERAEQAKDSSGRGPRGAEHAAATGTSRRRLTVILVASVAVRAAAFGTEGGWIDGSWGGEPTTREATEECVTFTRQKRSQWCNLWSYDSGILGLNGTPLSTRGCRGDAPHPGNRCDEDDPRCHPTFITSFECGGRQAAPLLKFAKAHGATVVDSVSELPSTGSYNLVVIGHSDKSTFNM